MLVGDRPARDNPGVALQRAPDEATTSLEPVHAGQKAVDVSASNVAASRNELLNRNGIVGVGEVQSDAADP